MAKNDFFQDNNLTHFEPPCPVALALDASGSMRGNRIHQLNNGLKLLQQGLYKDIIAASRVKVAIVRFSTKAELLQDFRSVEDLTFPIIKAGGNTNIEAGVRMAINLIENYKQSLRDSGLSYHRPYLILITDGGPYPREGQDIEQLSREIYHATELKKYNFHALGVENANMKVLNQLCNPKQPPQNISQHDFVNYFELLSHSLAMTSKSHVDITKKNII